MTFLANPIVFRDVPLVAEATHSLLSPLIISGLEGLLLGVVLWRWTSKPWPALLFGFLINEVTLALFWAALRRGGSQWDYDYGTVAVGECVVVVVEALAVMRFLAWRLHRDPADFWSRSFVLSLVLNSLSFLASVAVTTEHFPG